MTNRIEDVKEVNGKISGKIMRLANKLKDNKKDFATFIPDTGQMFYVLTEEQLNLIRCKEK